MPPDPPLLDEGNRGLFEALEEALMVLDPESGVVVDANAAAAALLHRERESLVGLPFEALLTPEDRGRTARILCREPEDRAGRPESRPCRCSFAGGGDLEVVSSAVEFPAGRRILVALRRSEVPPRDATPSMGGLRLVGSLLGSVGDMVFVHDGEGTLLEVNDQACAGLDRTRDELLRAGPGTVLGGRYEADLLRAASPGDRTGRSEVLEWTAVLPDGTERTFEAAVFRVGRGTGAPDGMVLISLRDVESRRRAEEDLRESETRYRMLMEQSSEAIFVIAVDGRVLDVNSMGCLLTGFSRRELLRRDVNAFLPGGEGPEASFPMEEVLAGEPVLVERRWRRKDGTPRVVEIGARGLWDGNILASVRDITERKRAEEALRASENRFRQIFEGIAEGIYRTTPEGRVLLANPALVRMLGYEDEKELLGIDVSRQGFVDPVERVSFQERMSREGAVSGHVSRWMRKDGSALYVRENARAVKGAGGKVTCYDGTVEDITEQVKTQADLRASEERYRKIFEGISEGIFLSTPEGRVILANPALIRMLGYDDLDDIRKRDIRSDGYFDEEDRRRFLEAIERDGEVRGWIGRWKRKDGTELMVREHARAVPDDRGGTLYFEGMIEDITEQERAKRALERSEKRYRTLFESIQDGVFIVEEGRLSYLNDAFVTMLGYERSEMIDRPFLEFIAEADRELVRDRYARRLASEDVPDEYEFSVLRKDGKHASVRIHVGLVALEGRVSLLGTVKDVTDRIQAENALREENLRLRKELRALRGDS